MAQRLFFTVLEVSTGHKKQRDLCQWSGMWQHNQLNPPNCTKFWGVYTLKWDILDLKAAKAHKLGYLFRVDDIVTI